MKKLLSVVLTVALCLGCVAMVACAPTKDENTLVMATNAAFPPYEFVDGEDYAGIDVEIAREMCKRLGYTLKIADVDFGAIIDGVQTGKYDFGMAGITVTDERKEQVNFTDSYATGVQVIIVNANSTIASLDDIFDFNDAGDPVAVKQINGHSIRVGVQQDTTGDIYCSDDVSKWGFNTVNDAGEVLVDNVTRYKTGAEAVEALKTGKVDIVVIDNEPAKSFVDANDGEIKILEGDDNAYAIEDYAICIAKSNGALLKSFNQTLAAMKADGTIDKIVAKYINTGDAK